MVANRRVTEDTAITGANVADGDLFDLVDISDSTDAATGTNKKITTAELRKTISGLYDATGHTLSLKADTAAVTLTDSTVDFVSHGRLALLGFTFLGHQMPTWFDPAESAWNTAGWFAFDYDPSHLYVTQHWGFGASQGASIRTGSAKNQMDVFATATQFGEDGNGAVWIGWDSNTKRRASIGPYSDVGTWQIALYDPTISDDFVATYIVSTAGNATQGVAANYGVGGSLGYTEMGSGTGGSYLLSIAQPSQTTGLLQLVKQDGSTGVLIVTQSLATLGVPLAMGANKITGLANGSSSDDAAAFGQIATAISALSSVYQPLDSDLTAIAALSTTSYGRAFLALANAAAAATAIDSNTTASTQAIGDAASTGTLGTLARGDHKHAMPAFATNAVVLGSAAAAGSAATLIRSDATIAAFDTTVPTTQAFGDAAAIGTAAFAARRDHKHAMPAAPTTIANDTLWTTAGDIAVATGNAAAARLAVGATPGQSLVVEPAAAGKHAYGWTRSLDDAHLVPTGAIAQSITRGRANVSLNSVIATGTLYLFGIGLAKGEVITSITFLSGSTALVSGANQWFGIFDSTRAPLAFTNDDTSTAWAATATKTLTIASTPYTTTAAGLYYIGIMVKANTPPTVAAQTVEAIANFPNNLTPIIVGASSTGLTNTASCPNPAGTLSGNLGYRAYFYLS